MSCIDVADGLNGSKRLALRFTLQILVEYPVVKPRDTGPA